MWTVVPDRAVLFTWWTGPLGCSVPVLHTWNSKPAGRQSPFGKHLAQVIVPLGRVAEKGMGEEG